MSNKSKAIHGTITDLPIGLGDWKMEQAETSKLSNNGGNRRSFLTMMLKGVVGFAIIPSAATYARRWKVTETLIVPEIEITNGVAINDSRLLLFASTQRKLFLEQQSAMYIILEST